MFSGAVKLEDISDFILPSQECVKPIVLGGKASSSSASAAVGGVAADDAATVRPDLIRLRPVSSRRGKQSTNGVERISTRTSKSGGGVGVLASHEASSVVRDPEPPALQSSEIASEVPPPAEAAQVSLFDCLACSGCVTTSEVVLMQDQSVQEFLRRSTAAPFSVVSFSSQSISFLAVHYRLPERECLQRLTWLLKTKLHVDMVLDTYASDAIVLIESLREFLSAYLSSQGNRQFSPPFSCPPIVAAPPPQSSVKESVGKASYGGIAGQKMSNNLPQKFIVHSQPPSSIFSSSLLSPTPAVPNSSAATAVSSLPVISSHCPGWICFAEKTQPAPIISHISGLKSSQHIQGYLAKSLLVDAVNMRRFWYSRRGRSISSNLIVNKRMGSYHQYFSSNLSLTKKSEAREDVPASFLSRPLTFAAEPSTHLTSGEQKGDSLSGGRLDTDSRYTADSDFRLLKPTDIYHVAVMPCFDKKLEAVRKENHIIERSEAKVEASSKEGSGGPQELQQPHYPADDSNCASDDSGLDQYDKLNNKSLRPTSDQSSVLGTSLSTGTTSTAVADEDAIGSSGSSNSSGDDVSKTYTLAEVDGVLASAEIIQLMELLGVKDFVKESQRWAVDDIFANTANWRAGWEAVMKGARREVIERNLLRIPEDCPAAGVGPFKSGGGDQGDAACRAKFVDGCQVVDKIKQNPGHDSNHRSSATSDICPVDGVESTGQEDQKLGCSLSTSSTFTLAEDLRILFEGSDGPLERNFEHPSEHCLCCHTVRLVTHHGGSGGFLEYIFRMSSRLLFNCQLPPGALNFRSGRNRDFQEITLRVDGQDRLRFALAYGFRNIQNIVKSVSQNSQQTSPAVASTTDFVPNEVGAPPPNVGNANLPTYDYVELMACPRGCLHGGGQTAKAEAHAELKSAVDSSPITDGVAAEGKSSHSLGMSAVTSDEIHISPERHPFVPLIYEYLCCPTQQRQRERRGATPLVAGEYRSSSFLQFAADFRVLRQENTTANLFNGAVVPMAALRW